LLTPFHIRYKYLKLRLNLSKPGPATHSGSVIMCVLDHMQHRDSADRIHLRKLFFGLGRVLGQRFCSRSSICELPLEVLFCTHEGRNASYDLFEHQQPRFADMFPQPSVTIDKYSMFYGNNTCTLAAATAAACSFSFWHVARCDFAESSSG
jgi:hypothetical protein